MTDPKQQTTTRRVLAALEKVFFAEIEGRLPFQSKAKVYIDLAEQGFLEPMERIFRAGDKFSVTASGYQLTHLGRLTYCVSCEGAEV